MTHYESTKTTNLNKTVSKNFGNTLLTNSGAYTGLIDKPEKYNYTLDQLKKLTNFSSNQVEYKDIDLITFTRLYKVGNIPVFDFVVVYIIFYAINALYLNFDYKIVLFGTIIFTLLFNLTTNKDCHLSYLIFFVLIITTYYLVNSIPSLKSRLKKLIIN